MSGKDEVEETNSGVKKKGSWKEVSEFAENVEDAMEESGFSEESVEEFEEWRPKKDEAEAEMREETVEKAAVSAREFEERSDGFREDIQEASERAIESGKNARNGEKKEAVSKVTEATEAAARPFYVRLIDLVRFLESRVYRFSLRFNPYYLDTEDVSADMKREKGGYELELNVPEREKRKQMKQGMGSEE